MITAYDAEVVRTKMALLEIRGILLERRASIAFDNSGLAELENLIRDTDLLFNKLK